MPLLGMKEKFRDVPIGSGDDYVAEVVIGSEKGSDGHCAGKRSQLGLANGDW